MKLRLSFKQGLEKLDCLLILFRDITMTSRDCNAVKPNIVSCNAGTVDIITLHWWYNHPIRNPYTRLPQIKPLLTLVFRSCARFIPVGMQCIHYDYWEVVCAIVWRSKCAGSFYCGVHHMLHSSSRDYGHLLPCFLQCRYLVYYLYNPLCLGYGI